MNEKHADNEFISEKKEIERIDGQIDKYKKQINSIDEISELFYSLNKSVQRSVDLLNHSIKGGNVEKELGSISDESNLNFRKTVSGLSDNREKILAKIKNLNEEKNSFLEKIRTDDNDE